MFSLAEQIKSKLDIVDVVSQYLKLEKSGVNYKAKCPFHNEKTPSFFVSPPRDSFYCFGCGKGGDIITFVEEIEGLDFIGAARILANRAGIQINQGDFGRSSETEHLLRVIEAAKNFYHDILNHDDEVVDYLLSARGITKESISLFEIGYAPAEWRALNDHLKSLGFSDAIQIKAGLIKKAEKASGHYDRFRNRIVFPIRNSSGATIGFSGRIFDARESKEIESAKYLNSPDGLLFDKSKILYGIDMAKLKIRQLGFCILVEGQIDLVLAHQAGYQNTVAVSGTALTAEHIKMVKRLTDKILMAFDGDDAGIRAAMRSIEEAFHQELYVSVVPLPQGVDPADLIKKNPEEWGKLVSGALSVIDFYLGVLREKNLSPDNFRKRVSKEVLPLVSKIQNKIEQAHYISRVAHELGIDEDSVWLEFRRQHSIGENRVTGSGSKPMAAKKKENKKTVLVHRILALLAKMEKDDSHDDITKSFEELAGQTLLSECRQTFEENKNRINTEIEIYYSGGEDILKEARVLIRNLEEELLKEGFGFSMMALRKAETEKNIDEIKKCLGECQEISGKLMVLKNKLS